MLQQTQVERVIPKFKVFITAFPTTKKLARASVADVLVLWSGLGYNRRALYLKKSAEVVESIHKGIFPNTYEALLELPGIGPYTAAAICAFAYNIPRAFIETNIRRVFLKFFFKERDGVADAEIFPLIEKMLDNQNPRKWYSALMDYGTMLKAKEGNANVRSKHYTKQSKFQGSDRQVRGEVLKFFIAQKKPVRYSSIVASVQRPPEKIAAKIEELVAEGFIKKKGKTFSLVS